MNCKFCNAELPEDMTLCRSCGKENVEDLPAEETAVGEVISEETAAGETIPEEVPAEAAVTEEPLTEETPTEETPAEETPTEETPAEDTPAEEAPRKKRNIWVTILAVIGGIALAAVLIGAVIYGMNTAGTKPVSYTVSDSKAEQERSTVVATVGDTELTNSELQVYYWQSVNEFYSYMGYYMDLTALGLDLSQPLDEQYYDEEAGTTWQQYFLQTALDTWHRYAVIGQLGQEAGFQLDAESQEYLDSIPQQLEELAVAYGYASAEDMLYDDMGPACDVEGYMRFITLNFYVGQYFEKIYDELEPTLEELEIYYAENEDTVLAMGIEDDGSKYVDVRHILFCPEGGTLDEETGALVYSDEEWEACRQKAQDLLDQWLEGDADEESFAQLAMEYSEDSGSQSVGGLYTDVYEGQMVEPFEDWCFDESRQYGDSGLVQTSYGYHIMYYVGSEPAWISDLRTQLVNERSTELVAQSVESRPMQTNLKKVVLSDIAEEE